MFVSPYLQVHDLMYSPAGREKGDVLLIDVPDGDPDFPPKTKLEFWRTERFNGTGMNTTYICIARCFLLTQS